MLGCYSGCFRSVKMLQENFLSLVFLRWPLTGATADEWRACCSDEDGWLLLWHEVRSTTPRSETGGDIVRLISLLWKKFRKINLRCPAPLGRTRGDGSFKTSVSHWLKENLFSRKMLRLKISDCSCFFQELGECGLSLRLLTVNHNTRTKRLNA